MIEITIPIKMVNIAVSVIILFGILRVVEIFRKKPLFDKFPLTYIKGFLYLILAIWIGANIVIARISEIDIITGFTFLFCCVEAVTNLTDALE